MRTQTRWPALDTTSFCCRFVLLRTALHSSVWGCSAATQFLTAGSPALHCSACCTHCAQHHQGNRSVQGMLAFRWALLLGAAAAAALLQPLPQHIDPGTQTNTPTPRCASALSSTG